MCLDLFTNSIVNDHVIAESFPMKQTTKQCLATHHVLLTYDSFV